MTWDRAAVVARIEITRKIRTVLDNGWQLVAMGIFGLFALPMLLGAGIGLFGFGAGVADGSFDAPLAIARRGTVYAWVSVALFGGFRAFSVGLDPDRIDGMLTTISHRDLVGGLVLAEIALWSAVLAGVAIPSAGAFGFGAGSPIAAVAFLVTAGLVLSSALLAGHLLALGARNMGTRSLLLTRLRTLLLGILAIAYFGVFATQSVGTILEPLYTVLGPTPIGWLGDLLLVGTGASVSGVRVAGGLLGIGAFLAVAWLAVARLAGALWYADGIHVTHSGEATGGWTGWLLRLLPRDVAAVVIVDWVRARRAPITLSFVLYPLLLLIWPIMSTFETGTIGDGFPLMVALSGAWITGSTFTLNVLGHEGAVLPVTILRPHPERPIVLGHVTASVILGVPVTLLATSALAVAAGFPVSAVVTLAASTLILGVSAPLLASGLGALLPRFDEVTVSRSTEAVIPSMLAFGTYSIALSIVALPMLAVHGGFAPWLADVVGTPAGVVRLVGLALTTVAGLGGGAMSVRYALRRVATFELAR